MPTEDGSVVCSLPCARGSVGAAVWFSWFEQECKNRIHRRNGKVITLPPNKLNQIA